MNTSQTHGDIDIDMADRNLLLRHIHITPASIRDNNGVKKHNTGVHPTDIPVDPLLNICALDYREAERRDYIKLDLLNIAVYKMIKNEAHLLQLMQEPQWSALQNRSIFEQLIHISRHWDVMMSMQEPINSISRMAMFLALIRPGKKHLQGKSWSEISKTIWERESEGYQFKKAHGVAYAHLVVVHLNLLTESR